jgi:hypothetical protein
VDLSAEASKLENKQAEKKHEVNDEEAKGRHKDDENAFCHDIST